MMDFIKKHPMAIVAIAAIVLYAFIKRSSAQAASASSGDGTGVQFSGGGEIAPSIDPNVAAIMEAEIAGKTQDFGTYASAVVGSQQSSDSLSAAEAGDYAGLVSNLTSSGDSLQAALASIAAQRDVAINSANDSLSATQAEVEAEIQAAESRVASSGNGGTGSTSAQAYTSWLSRMLAGMGIVLTQTQQSVNGSSGYTSPQLLQYINELQLSHMGIGPG